MRKSKLVARILTAAIIINTTAGAATPEQKAWAGQTTATGDAVAGTTAVKQVSLNPAGGTVPIQEITVEPGKPYGTLPTPVREGYDFVGWYAQENGGTRLDETSLSGATTVLYAHWQPLCVRVDLYAVGGKLDVDSIQVTYGETYGALPTPQKAGFSFDGWYTAYDGGEKVNKTDTVTITSAVPLYAHWKGGDVTVSFHAEGVEGEIPARTVQYGMAYGTLPEVGREGYLFAGWYDSAQGGRRVRETTPVTSQGAHTLHAQWSEDEAKITLDADGGECSPVETTVY